MLAVLAYFFFGTYSLLNNYLSYSIITNTQEVHVDGLRLPSVTVCDYDGFQCKMNVYRGARAKNSGITQKCKASDLIHSAECFVNNTMKNCTAKKLPNTPACITINPNQTIVQKTDGRSRLFLFMVHPASQKGVRLFFHQHNEIPTPYQDILTHAVESGVYNVVLKQKNYSRLPKPYPSQCVPELYRKGSPFMYTKKLCEQQCHAKSLLKNVV